MARISVIDGNSLITVTPTIIDTEDSNKVVGKGNPQEIPFSQLADLVSANITVTLTGDVTGSGTGDGSGTITIATTVTP